jgi:hypothetical protein
MPLSIRVHLIPPSNARVFTHNDGVQMWKIVLFTKPVDVPQRGSQSNRCATIIPKDFRQIPVCYDANSHPRQVLFEHHIANQNLPDSLCTGVLPLTTLLKETNLRHPTLHQNNDQIISFVQI